MKLSINNNEIEVLNLIFMLITALAFVLVFAAVKLIFQFYFKNKKS